MNSIIYRTRLLIVFIWMLLAFDADAYNLRQLSNRDGLSNSAVLSLLQDSNGFLWMGTCDGINIYNGRNILNGVRMGRPDLSGYVIEAMCETQNGDVWVLTNYGLHRMSVSVGNRVYPQFKGSYKMTKNTQDDLFVLANDNTVYAYHRQKQNFYRLQLADIRQQKVTNLYVGDHELVVFTTTAVYCYQIEQREGYYRASLVYTERDTPIKYGFGDGEQIYWIDGDCNLWAMNEERPVKRLISNWKQWIGHRGRISDILRDGDVYFVGFQTDGVVRISHSADGREIMDDLGIHTGTFRLLKDQNQDIIWIGTDGQGVYMYYNGRYSLQSVTYRDLNLDIAKPVRSVFVDQEHTLWLGTKGEGILRIKNFNPDMPVRNMHIESINSENSVLTDNSVYKIAKSRRRLIWLGGDGGLSYYSYANRQIMVMPTAESIRYVHDIYEADDSTLWLATVGTGVLKLTLGGGDSPYVRSMKRYTIDRGNFSSNYFFSLFVDTNRNVWFGNRGNGLFTLVNEHLVNIPIAKSQNVTLNDVFAVYREGTTTWLGTGYGVVRMMGDSLRIFNRNNGFPNHTIHSLLMDRNRYLWVSTNQGLVCLNTQNDELQSYDRLNGLDIMEFSDGAAYADGRTLYFGGINGFVIVRENPQYRRTDDAYSPPLRLTGLEVLGVNQVLSEYIHGDDRYSTLHLSSDENSFTLSFTALDYINPNNYVYQYRLDPDGIWIRNEGRGNISFTELGYGDYTLEVRYQNRANGTYSPISRLKIHVSPPFYLSVWACLLYVILAMLVLGLLVRYLISRQRSKRRETIERMKRRHREEVYEEKLRFFTNITHEFCTPLTLIYGPCERLEQYEKSDSYILKYVSLIKANTERLNALIQEVIDFRRLDTGHQTCVIKSLDISLVCADVVHSFMELAEQNHIRFTSSVSEGIVWNSDYNCLTKILNNLISNAFKYTEPHGEVKVSVSTETDCLNIEVFNTGKGIKASDIPIIFNRYKVLDNIEENAIHGLTARNGLGLAICHSMVELLHGEIRVESEEGQYARFVVRLPQLLLTEGEPVNTVLPNLTHSVSAVTPRPTTDAVLPVSADSDAPLVLIVDDNRDVLHLISEGFLSHFRVVTATRAAEALKLIRNNTPELIITDVMMPDMDGIAFTRELKQNSYTTTIPVIMLSARNTSDEKIEGLNAGADAYVGKPFDISYLLAMAERLVETNHKMKSYYSSAAASFGYSHGQVVRSDDKEFLYQMDRYLEAHIGTDDFSFDEMATAFQMSARTLYRKFKELNLGRPKEYIKEFRLTMVARLLRTTSLTVQEIMYKTGFSNRSHFYREFQKRFGMTPKEYREHQE